MRDRPPVALPSIDLPGPSDYGMRHANRHPPLRTRGSGEEDRVKRQNSQPPSLSKRVVGGHVLYSHVVVVEGKRTIFVSGQLARGPAGEVVGAGDMRAQLRQVGENIKAAL